MKKSETGGQMPNLEVKATEISESTVTLPIGHKMSKILEAQNLETPMKVHQHHQSKEDKIEVI